jgi:hypothetical protein
MPLPREQSYATENRSEPADTDLRPKYALSGGTNTGLVSIPMGVLLGDVNASGRVDAADVSIAPQQTLTSLP